MSSAMTSIGVLALLLLVSHSTYAIHWDHAAQLNDDFRLLWNINGADLTFEMQVRTHGYIGLGFARAGDSRAGADAIIGWVDRGQTYFQDRHIDSHFAAAIDDSQDYAILLGYENATHTVMRFKRRLDTCDPLTDVPISNDTMRVLLIYHANSEPRDGSTALPGPLGNSAPETGRTPVAIQAIVPLQLTGRTQGTSDAASSFDRTPSSARQNVHIVELRNEAVPLPPHSLAADGEPATLEWCRPFELRQFAQKHHMIQYEPVFGSARARHQLDALVLYECQGTATRLTAWAQQGGGVCAELRRHSKGVVCEAVVASWTRGSAGLTFPPEAGYPFDSHKERFYLMESHYSSGSGSDASGADAIPMDLATTFAAEPALDNSGLRLHVTAVLRPHDAGVLSIGMSPDWRHIIPPGQHRVISEGHCVDECTRRSLAPAGISIFAVVMQTHSIGKRVRLRQVRQHAELLPIAADAGVHSEYAEFRRIEPAARVLPGDTLIAECTYDSSAREAITLGSASARRGESCQVLAVYYPHQRRMTRCHSLPSLPTVLHSLGIDELAYGSQPVLITAPPALAGMTLESRLLGYDWSGGFEQFERVTRAGSFEAVCRSARGKVVAGTDGREYRRPQVTQEWSQKPVEQCEQWKLGGKEDGGSGDDNALDRAQYVTNQTGGGGGGDDELDVESMSLSAAGRISSIVGAMWLLVLLVTLR